MADPQHGSRHSIALRGRVLEIRVCRGSATDSSRDTSSLLPFPIQSVETGFFVSFVPLPPRAILGSEQAKLHVRQQRIQLGREGSNGDGGSRQTSRLCSIPPDISALVVTMEPF